MAKSQLLSLTDKQTQVWSLELCTVDVEKTIAISKGLTINVNFILENASFPKHDEQELLLLVTDRETEARRVGVSWPQILTNILILTSWVFWGQITPNHSSSQYKNVCQNMAWRDYKELTSPWLLAYNSASWCSKTFTTAKHP